MPKRVRQHADDDDERRERERRASAIHAQIDEIVAAAEAQAESEGRDDADGGDVGTVDSRPDSSILRDGGQVGRKTPPQTPGQPPV